MIEFFQILALGALAVGWWLLRESAEPLAKPGGDRRGQVDNINLKGGNQYTGGKVAVKELVPEPPASAPQTRERRIAALQSKNERRRKRLNQ